MTGTIDLDHLRQWIGRSAEASDIVTAQLVKGLRATLFQGIGEPKMGDAAPFTTHWCLAQPVFPMSELGPDGIPRAAASCRRWPLPRRMWAGGELEFFDALRIGDEVKRVSRIADVTMKTGSTGTLCFVAVVHEVTTSGDWRSANGRISFIEKYPVRLNPRPPSRAAAPPTAQHRETHVSDPVLLFRYSALTFTVTASITTATMSPRSRAIPA